MPAVASQYPQNKEWPREIFFVIEFREQGDKTLVTVEWSPYHASAEESTTFDSAHIEMTIGWRGSFNRLDAYLNRYSRCGKTLLSQSLLHHDEQTLPYHLHHLRFQFS